MPQPSVDPAHRSPVVSWQRYMAERIFLIKNKILGIVLAHSATSHCFTPVAVNDVLQCLNVTKIHVWFPPTLCTMSPTITKSTIPLKNKTTRNTTVSVNASQLLVCVYWVITVCTQNWFAVRRVFSSSNIAIFTSLLLQWPMAKGAPFSKK